jgi:hypothetical protein
LKGNIDYVKKNFNLKDKFILKTVDKNNIKLSLVYRGSRDGFLATDFHKHCDNIGPNIVLIQTTNNFIFGGYSRNWNQLGTYDTDHSQYIFTLVNNSKIMKKIDIIKGKNGAQSTSNSILAFGNGHDIYIASGCDSNTTSYSNLGLCYQLNNINLKYGTPEAKNFLAGSYNFQVKEIEVFIEKSLY